MNKIKSKCYESQILNVQGGFFHWYPPISVPKRKPAKQPITAQDLQEQQLWLAGWRLSFWYWNWGVPVKTTTLYNVTKYSSIIFALLRVGRTQFCHSLLVCCIYPGFVRLFVFKFINSWSTKSKLVSLCECEFIFYPYIDSPQNSRVHRGNLITIGWGEEHNNIGPILTSTQYSVYPPCGNDIFSMILHHVARTSGDVGTFRHVKIVALSCGRHYWSIAIFLHCKCFGRHYWLTHSMKCQSWGMPLFEFWNCIYHQIFSPSTWSLFYIRCHFPFLEKRDKAAVLSLWTHKDLSL